MPYFNVVVSVESMHERPTIHKFYGVKATDNLHAESIVKQRCSTFSDRQYKVVVKKVQEIDLTEYPKRLTRYTEVQG